MPASTITVTRTRDWCEGNVYKVLGTIAWSPSADTYTSGGNLCNFGIGTIKATRKPLVVYLQGLAGYNYVYVPGTTALDGLVKILTGAAAQAPGTELTAGAVPAGVSNDTIIFEALFPGTM